MFLKRRWIQCEFIYFNYIWFLSKTIDHKSPFCTYKFIPLHNNTYLHNNERLQFDQSRFNKYLFFHCSWQSVLYLQKNIPSAFCQVLYKDVRRYSHLNLSPEKEACFHHNMRPSSEICIEIVTCQINNIYSVQCKPGNIRSKQKQSSQD